MSGNAIYLVLDMINDLVQVQLAKENGIPVMDDLGSGALLEQVEAAGLFLKPLDDARQWFRYHRLFAEALQARHRDLGQVGITLGELGLELVEHAEQVEGEQQLAAARTARADGEGCAAADGAGRFSGNRA